jgi:hypothetical protein
MSEQRSEKRSTEKRRAEKRRTEKRRTEKKRTEKKRGGKRSTDKRSTDTKRTEKRRGGKRSADKRSADKRSADKRSADKRSSKSHCEYNATMLGLNEWYVSMYENLGWMVLAKQRGNMEDKILVYMNSLRRLMHKIECKIHSVHDHDNKEDLKIMWENVKILIEHAEKDL